jgi:hypothetical protein
VFSTAIKLLVVAAAFFGSAFILLTASIDHCYPVAPLLPAFMRCVKGIVNYTSFNGRYKVLIAQPTSMLPAY